MKPEQAKKLRAPFPPEQIGKELGPCLEFRGARDPRGYGRRGIGGKVRFAHVIAYEEAYGPVPNGLELDHLCMNPPCCEPRHLEAVTHAENMRRAGRAGVLGSAQRSRTHCPSGHAYDDENTYWWKGERSCKECRRASYRRWYQRKGGRSHGR